MSNVISYFTFYQTFNILLEIKLEEISQFQNIVQYFLVEYS